MRSLLKRGGGGEKRKLETGGKEIGKGGEVQKEKWGWEPESNG